MIRTLIIFARFSGGAYVARAEGVTASSTMSASEAATRKAHNARADLPPR